MVKYLKTFNKPTLLNLAPFLNHQAKRNQRKNPNKSQIIMKELRINKMGRMIMIDLKWKFKLEYRFLMNLKK